MATQQGNLGTRASMGALLQENYEKGVKKWFGMMDPVAAIFMRRATGGKYKLSGKKLVITVETDEANSAMATPAGQLPDHDEVTPQTIETVPTRRYVRSAIDNFMEAVGKGPGAAENYLKRLNRQHLQKFKLMEHRHVHGSTTATLAVVSARTSATVLVLKDGLGYVGQGPLAYLRKGQRVALLDASDSYNVLGVTTISNIAHATNTVTFASGIDDGVTVAAAGDVLVMATTTDTDADYFATERGAAPLGLLDIVDPKAQNSSFMGLSETTYPRWKPIRRTSTSFDDMEFDAFLRQLEAKSTEPVTPRTHTMTTQPGILQMLAQALTDAGNARFVQEKGKTLNGGYETVRVSGHDFVTSGDHIFDTIYALPMDDLHRVHLGNEFADVAEDGSIFARLPNWDAKEWYGRDYMQQFADRRNRIGALTGIANTSANLYTNQPD